MQLSYRLGIKTVLSNKNIEQHNCENRNCSYNFSIKTQSFFPLLLMNLNVFMYAIKLTWFELGYEFGILRIQLHKQIICMVCRTYLNIISRWRISAAE